MGNQFVDQRKHKRYAATDKAIAICNTKVGRIIDISRGGMAVIFTSNDSFSGEDRTTIFSKYKNLLIEEIPMIFVREIDTQSTPTSPFQIRTVGIQFNYSNSEQQDQIKQYLTGLTLSDN